MRAKEKNYSINSYANPNENYSEKKRKILDRLINLNLSTKQISMLTISRMETTRILYYNKIYQHILNKPGVIMEFGVQYGEALLTLIKLRGIYEPYNLLREIIGFDTFEGFTNNFTKEEKKNNWKKGDYGVPRNFESLLDELLKLEESNSPINWLRKYKLIKGDATETVKKYLKDNPHTVIGMAIFDMDVYKPTKKVLEIIKPRLFKGSILVFDELNQRPFPGETLAIMETIGLNNLKFNSFEGQNGGSWAIIE